MARPKGYQIDADETLASIVLILFVLIIAGGNAVLDKNVKRRLEIENTHLQAQNDSLNAELRMRKNR